MNSFNLKNLTKLKNTELYKVKRIQDLVTAAESLVGKEEQLKDAKKQNDGKYNSANVYEINVYDYISFLETQSEKIWKSGNPNARHPMR